MYSVLLSDSSIAEFRGFPSRPFPMAGEVAVIIIASSLVSSEYQLWVLQVRIKPFIMLMSAGNRVRRPSAKPS